MYKTSLKFAEDWHDDNFEERLMGRQIVIGDISPLLSELHGPFQLSAIGSSFEGRNIYKVSFGSGKIKILLWTQMHGNESTGTKAFFDLLKWFHDPGDLLELRDELIAKLMIVTIPILNPDGAESYTRISAQGIDLNRDVLDRLAPESILLQDELQGLKPDYCFNLHDQRTIFSVGAPPKAATISFLAPSEEKSRKVTEGRKKTMQVISAIYHDLKGRYAEHIGRYTDEFYPTATGDNFQKMGYPTILIESGHFPGDYERAVSRKLTFMSLLSGLIHVSRGDLSNDHSVYFEIPDNEKLYLDVIVKNVQLNGRRTDLGIVFKEEVAEGKVVFVPNLEKIEVLDAYGSDKYIDGESLMFKSESDAEKWIKIEFN